MSADLYTRGGRLLRARDRVKTLDGREWLFISAEEPTDACPMGRITLRDPACFHQSLRDFKLYPSAINASFLK